MENKTDSEKIEQLSKQMKTVYLHSYIQTIAVVLAFIGIASLHQIIKKK